MPNTTKSSKGVDQAETISFLERARSFGLDGKVVRIDTHISHIFLIGDQAYKLKRAVQYDYLDFATREKRKRACEIELQLNRRTAPEIYQEVRSVNRQPDGTLGFGPGEPVDWVVVMQRFDADGLLEEVAGRGELTTPLVNQLADIITDFHASLDPVIRDEGSASLVDIIEENYQCMGEYEGRLFPAKDIAILRHKSMDESERLKPVLDDRARHGHIRHCHGDLHLANICMWKGVPTLFDCLEFNAELATTDVLYDLAFLLMDLWHRGFHDHANALYNRYLDMSEESSGLAALPLFLSMRAAIRAHVIATQANLEPDETRRCEREEKAKSYLATALAFLQKSPPLLIAIGGLSGTGKSTLAAAIAPQIGSPPGARLLRTDIVRKRMFGVSPETKLASETYTPEKGERVYALLLDKIAATLKSGRPTIVDGVFAEPSERQTVEKLAIDVGASFAGIWLNAPLDQLKERVDARRGDASDADSSVVERQAEYRIGDLGGWIEIDSSEGASKVVASALCRLAASKRMAFRQARSPDQEKTSL